MDCNSIFFCFWNFENWHQNPYNPFVVTRCRNTKANQTWSCFCLVLRHWRPTSLANSGAAQLCAILQQSFHYTQTHRSRHHHILPVEFNDQLLAQLAELIPARSCLPVTGHKAKAKDFQHSPRAKPHACSRPRPRPRMFKARPRSDTSKARHVQGQAKAKARHVQGQAKAPDTSKARPRPRPRPDMFKVRPRPRPDTSKARPNQGHTATVRNQIKTSDVTYLLQSITINIIIKVR